MDSIGSFWWKDILKLTPIYRGITRVQVVDGLTTLLWKDLWSNDVLQSSHPRAFSFALHEEITVADFWANTELHETFHLPLSARALNEVRDVQRATSHIHPSTTISDVLHYIWGATEYRPKDYYNNFFRDATAHPSFRRLWKSNCTMKIKVFGWFLLQDRLNTRDMLRRRHYDNGDDFTCLLCGRNIQETLEHMILTCQFSEGCWAKIGVDWPDFHNRFVALQNTQTIWPNPFFIETFYTAAWSLWKERNNKHFRGVAPSITSWFQRFKEDLGLLQHRVKGARRAALLSYCDTLS